MRATVVMPVLRASLMAFFSFLGSITTKHSGNRASVRMPPRLRSILRYSRRSEDCIFFEYAPNSSEGNNFSSCSNRASRLRMVRKFVSVPPSQRSLT